MVHRHWRGVWEMFQAAIAGDTATLGRMLDANPALVRCHYQYKSPLHFALRAGQSEASRFLIARGMRGDDPGEDANAPIHWAVMKRDIPLLDELLAKGADINQRRDDGARPIHLTSGDYHFRALKDAAATPREVLDHLIARGAYIDICTAAHMGKVDRVRELLDNDPSLANRNSDYCSYYLGSGSALKNAAAKGHLDVVRLLLERGADPNLPEEHIAPDGQALYSAAAGGHYEIAELLLRHEAYPNVEVESSADTLSRALSNEDVRMVELLCSHGAARSVMLLAYYGDLRTAAAVFAVKPDLAEDAPALMAAAAQGHEPFVRLMLRYRPDLPARITQLAWEKGPKTDAIADLLFDHGLNPSQPDWLLVTPLHEFAKKGDVENARRFLARGADRTARDEEFGLTPLEWAQKYGQTAMAELLQL